MEETSIGNLFFHLKPKKKILIFMLELNLMKPTDEPCCTSAAELF